MSFDTERPKTTSQRIQAFLETKQTRAKNLKALVENAKIEKNTAYAQGVLESAQIQQQQNDVVTETVNRLKQQRKQQQFIQESTVGRLSLLENAKNTVMNKVLFEMIYDAYWLDTDVKEATIQESYDTYRSVMETVEKVCGKSKTPDMQKTKFIHAVEGAVSDICTKAVDRIITEAKETGELNLEFNLTTEEEAELDNKLSELGRDDIVDLVKDKVLSVVQDERECGKEKASILQELNSDGDEEPDDITEDDTDNMSGESEEPVDDNVKESTLYSHVEEGAMAGAVISAAVLGTVIVGVALSVKDKIELKKALKVYEKNCKPAIKMSELTPTMYKLDSAHRVTNSELTGIKKFLNQNSKRAKVWKDSKGHVVCTAILYTTTKITPGIQATSDGISPTVDVQRTAHYLYDVDSKYKKDELYLSAYMAFTDNYGTDNSHALTNDMKKAFKDDMKNTKVKLFGKSLESVGVIEHISPAFVEYECACELLEECGVSGLGAEATYLCAMNETDPQKAIKLFGEYKDILQQGKTSILIAPADKYSHRVKTTVTNAITTQQQICDTNIDKITKQMNTPAVHSPEELITAMKQQNIKRVMNRTGSGTLFESMMVANTKKTAETAVTEGVSINQEDAINAALIESILQYTVLETLNTLQIYKFTDGDVNHLKTMNRSSVQ